MPLRLVLDTNIWLDWLVFRDECIDSLKAAVASGNAAIFIDSDCRRELARVLAYRRRKTPLDATAQAACMEECANIAINVESSNCRGDAGTGTEIPLPRCRDRDDQKFLELARNCGADFLITKDNALLELASRRVRTAPFRIVTPQQFDALHTAHGRLPEPPVQRRH